MLDAVSSAPAEAEEAQANQRQHQEGDDRVALILFRLTE